VTGAAEFAVFAALAALAVFAPVEAPIVGTTLWDLPVSPPATLGQFFVSVGG